MGSKLSQSQFRRFHRTVDRAIIDDNDFKIPPMECAQRMQGFRDAALAIKARYNNGEHKR
jgi:hypothetical protein